MINKLPGNTPEEQNEYLQRTFRNVFNTDDGKVVLNVILDDLHYFKETKCADDVALSNYARVLISERLGFSDTISRTEKLFECEHKK